MYKNIQTLIL